MSVPSTEASPAAGAHGASVLISGASFAGLATAYWMQRLGYSVAVVEVADGLRRGGTPVDIEGETIEVLDRMGLIDAVRSKALPPRGFAFKDADDATLGALGAGSSSDDGATSRYEMHRDDLLDILFEAVRPNVAFVFGRSIVRIDEGAHGATVTLDDGSSRDYHLVCGCDGNRSNTRRLVFCVHFMGGYFFLKVVPNTDLLPANMSQVYSAPGRTAMLNGYDDRTDIGLMFRTDRQIAYDYRDRAAQRRLLHAHFDGLGWKTPAMLEHIDADDDFYFDRVNQLRMPAWSKGRVTLMGDAGYCVSPLAGFGGSMAIIGASRLAQALQQHGEDHTAAFRAYDAGLRPFVEAVQEKAATAGMSIMVPADEAAITERDRKLRTGEIDL
ncbi:MAG: FAD-dependent monooxygenase [Caulobacteraceae bacterium]